jgi:hypothetical protein
MFQEHFDYYSDDLIPEECLDDLDPDFVKFLTQVIIHRKKVNEAITETGSTRRLLVSEVRDKIIIKNMAYLRNSESLGAKSLYHIIMDFDAWNNFRVLPKELQEPHAFTRRNKNRYKKFISNLMGLNDFIIAQICDTYEAKGLDGAVLYLVLPYKQITQSKIIPIDKDPDTINQISNMGLFLFSSSDKAKEFLTLIVSYWNLDIKHPKEGQVFWKAYRNILADVYNMRELENIVPDREIPNGSYQKHNS